MHDACCRKYCISYILQCTSTHMLPTRKASNAGRDGVNCSLGEKATERTLYFSLNFPHNNLRLVILD